MVGYDLEAREFVHKGENLDVKALGDDNGKDSTSARFPTVRRIFTGICSRLYGSSTPVNLLLAFADAGGAMLYCV